jgi:hypothetical protein
LEVELSSIGIASERNVSHDCGCCRRRYLACGRKAFCLKVIIGMSDAQDDRDVAGYLGQGTTDLLAAKRKHSEHVTPATGNHNHVWRACSRLSDPVGDRALIVHGDVDDLQPKDLAALRF